MSSLLALAEARQPHDGAISLPPQIQHLSASSIAMWLRCHEQYRRRYILGQKERPGEAMILGGGFWDAQVQANLSQKIQTGLDRPTSEVEEAFSGLLSTAVEKAGGKQDVAWDTNFNDAEQLGLKMTAAYHENVSPRLQPIEVESEFNHYIDGVNVPLNGYIDLEAVASEPGSGAEAGIIEAKTSKAKVIVPKPEWRIQGRIYQLVRAAPIHWHVITKTKKQTKIWTPLGPAHEEKEEDTGLIPALSIAYNELAAKQTEKLARLIAGQIAAMYALLGPDEAWDGTGLSHTWACSRCGWRSACEWMANQ